MPEDPCRATPAAVLTLLFAFGTIVRLALPLRHRSRKAFRGFSVVFSLFPAVVILLNVDTLGWIFGVHDASEPLWVGSPQQGGGGIDNGLFDWDWGNTMDRGTYVGTIAPKVKGYQGGWLLVYCHMCMQCKYCRSVLHVSLLTATRLHIDGLRYHYSYCP